MPDHNYFWSKKRYRICSFMHEFEMKKNLFKDHRTNSNSFSDITFRLIWMRDTTISTPKPLKLHPPNWRRTWLLTPIFNYLPTVWRAMHPESSFLNLTIFWGLSWERRGAGNAGYDLRSGAGDEIEKVAGFQKPVRSRENAERAPRRHLNNTCMLLAAEAVSWSITLEPPPTPLSSLACNHN